MTNEPDPPAAPIPQLGAEFSALAPPPLPIRNEIQTQAHSLLGPFTRFRERDFRLLWAGTMAQGLSQWGQQISLTWLVYVLTGSAVELGKVAFLGGIISLVLSPFAGLLADRYSRRTIMVITSALGALQATLLAFLVVSDLIQPWHAYAFAVTAALTNTATVPAQQAFVHDISTPQTLTQSIALLSIAQNVSRIVGPPLTGIIVAWSMGAAFIVVAGMRALSAITAMLLVKQPKTAQLSGHNPFADVLAGFRYLATDRQLLLLLTLSSLPSLFVVPYLNFFPLFASEVFHGGSREYGLLASMLAIGSIVGMLLLARSGDIRHKARYVLYGELIYVVLVVTFTRTSIFVLALGFLATAGLFHSVARAVNTSMFQANVRSDMRGRGMAAFQMGSALMPIGALQMGLLIDRFGIQDGVMISQLFCGAGVLLILLFGKSVRNT